VTAPWLARKPGSEKDSDPGSFGYRHSPVQKPALLSNLPALDRLSTHSATAASVNRTSRPSPVGQNPLVVVPFNRVTRWPDRAILE